MPQVQSEHVHFSSLKLFICDVVVAVGVVNAKAHLYVFEDAS